MTKLDALKELKAKVQTGDRFILGSAERAGFAAWQASTAEQVTMHGSLDAAKALHEAVLPEIDWEIDGDGFVTITYPADPYSGHWPEENKNNPARAWLIAILSALIARETEA